MFLLNTEELSFMYLICKLVYLDFSTQPCVRRFMVDVISRVHDAHMQ